MNPKIIIGRICYTEKGFQKKIPGVLVNKKINITDRNVLYYVDNYVDNYIVTT